MSEIESAADDQRALAGWLQERGVVTALSKSGWLLRVDFRQSPVNANDASVHALAHSVKLKELYLAGSTVTPACIDDLLTLENLSLLDIANTALDDSAIERLAGLPNLSMLVVRGTQATQEGIRALRKRLTRVRIVG